MFFYCSFFLFHIKHANWSAVKINLQDLTPTSFPHSDEIGLIKMSEKLTEKNDFLPSLYTLSLSIDHTKSTFKGKIYIDLKESGRKNAEYFEVTLNSSKIVVTSATLQLGESKGEAEKLKIVYNKEKEQTTFFNKDLKVEQAECQLVLEYVGQINQIKTYSDPTLDYSKPTI